MDSADITGSPDGMLARLVAATNAHNLDGLVDCFQPDYVNETPAHPARGFVGRDQVRANWHQIFAAVPDLHTEVLRSATAADSVWAEMEMSGTRKDGSRHLMRGVVVFGVVQGRAAWARFYLEPVQEGGADINSVVASQVGAGR
jgi:ketosteroid isomerase-like protein